MIEIKRNVADDIRKVADQMQKDAYKMAYKMKEDANAMRGKSDALYDDAIMLDLAADANHRYQVMVDNGINENLAVALAVHLTKR